MQNIKQQFDVMGLDRKENEFLSQNQILDEDYFNAFYNLSTQSEQLSCFDNMNEVEIQQKDKKNLQEKKCRYSIKVNKKRMKCKISNRRKPRKIKEFQLDEDIRLLQSIQQYGRQFSRLVKLFPKRTVSMLKNRYYKNLRYKVIQRLDLKFYVNIFDIQENLNIEVTRKTFNQIYQKKRPQKQLQMGRIIRNISVYIEENEELFIENDSVNQSIEQVDHKSLINMLPESYSCSKIRNMLESFITRVNDILNVQF